MTLVLWYLGCLAIGAVAGSHSGVWGGLGILILGVPVYFMLPARARTVITERHMIAGAAIVLGAAVAFYPLLAALGVVASG